MPTHNTINGRTIEYEPTPAELRFLREVEAAVADPSISEAQLRAQIYGPDNPLLDQRAGYSFVTPAAFESPIYRVLLDLLDRKRVAAGSLDLEKVAARYTMTVAEAAAQLGLSVGAVRTAVTSGRLPAWKRDGELWLDPVAVDGYQVIRRGPPPRLAVTCGSKEGASMRVRVVGGEELQVTGKEGGLVRGTISSWERVGVITSAKRTGRSGEPETTYRYWLLEPGGAEQKVELGPFSVTGRFSVTEKRNGKAASEAFHALGRKV